MEGRVQVVNGPVVSAIGMKDFKLREMVLVGEKKLIGEIVKLEEDFATIQVYEETTGLKSNEIITSTGKPLSIKLGPGLLNNIFDGIERPLVAIKSRHGDFMPEGIGLLSIDTEKKWDIKITVNVGDKLSGGEIFGEVPETEIITHRLLIPNDVTGVVKSRVNDGKYTIDDCLLTVEDEKGNSYKVTASQDWPVRVPRPVQERLPIKDLLTTGQRVIDTFFPIAKGGTSAIPGGFGTGKTMTQHQIAKFCDADIIIYIGCGERGNEMTEVLEDFPKLIDPNSGKSLMDRTILIANTSNMPVAAREASIYTGITIAEYYRDQGYHVALMADSTSRWAEALREISGRLEEMPAEEGYPAYLPSRISAFYERAGYVKTLSKREASLTLIGAVSPVGGDFSEPVTENTKRFVNVFLALDKQLAYQRHYPAINWTTSYSSYLPMLKQYYEDNLDGDLQGLRNFFMDLLSKEGKIREIVMLVGEDVLPDSEKLTLVICDLLKTAFLQQNAFHAIDTFVPLNKQYEMLYIIYHYNKRAGNAINERQDITFAANPELLEKIRSMKYDIGNDEMNKFRILKSEIDNYFDLSSGD